MRLFKITLALALTLGTAMSFAATVAEISNGLNVTVLEGKITLQLSQDFVDRTPQDKTAQDTGVTVQLFANQKHSQVVGISAVRTVNGDANDTGDAAFNKMAQGALSGLKTQFKDVKKTGQTSVMINGHKFLRIDSEQEMKDSAMVGTLLITPYDNRVVTLQVLSLKSAIGGHNALVRSIISTVAFH